MAYVDSESTQSGGGWCCQRVDNGRLVIGVTNNDCKIIGGVVSSAPFTLRLSIAPDYRVFMDGPPPSDPNWQPDSVYAVLGDGFEYMTGPDVTHVAGMNMLQVKADYQLPSDTCEPQ
jgi:hypothetical protein